MPCTLAPRRFGQGPEALQPWFRWANGTVVKKLQVQNVLQKAEGSCLAC